MSFEQITIVGVGLIGGSVGMAARAKSAAQRVVGVDSDATALDRALSRGAIDVAARDLAEGVRDAGLVVVCTPVDRIGPVIVEAARSCKTGTLFTDGGSTKANIIADVNGRLPTSIDFIPAHPLAGSEKSGVEQAQADLFHGRTVIVAPMRGNGDDSIGRVVQFWQALGANIHLMDPEVHDRILAITSHLPHAVAAAVAGGTPIELLEFTAGGFRDVTRIAAGDPRMWSAVFQANRESILEALASFTDQLAAFRTMVESGDSAGLFQWLTEAKRVRDALESHTESGDSK